MADARTTASDAPYAFTLAEARDPDNPWVRWLARGGGRIRFLGVLSPYSCAFLLAFLALGLVSVPLQQGRVRSFFTLGALLILAMSLLAFPSAIGRRVRGSIRHSPLFRDLSVTRTGPREVAAAMHGAVRVWEILPRVASGLIGLALYVALAAAEVGRVNDTVSIAHRVAGAIIPIPAAVAVLFGGVAGFHHRATEAVALPTGVRAIWLPFSMVTTAGFAALRILAVFIAAGYAPLLGAIAATGGEFLVARHRLLQAHGRWYEIEEILQEEWREIAERAGEREAAWGDAPGAA